MWSLWLPVATYLAFIFGLSSISNPPSLLPGSDKEAHAVLYAGLALLILRGLAGGRLRQVTLGAMCGAAVLAALYGVTDEWHQRFVPGRSYEYADMLADAVGAVAGMAVVGLWSKIRHVF